MRRSYPTPSTELLASDTSSIEGGPPFIGGATRVGNFDERQWGISASAIKVCCVMDNTQFSRFAPLLRDMTEAQLASEIERPRRLLLATGMAGGKRIDIAYAPLDHVNVDARIVIVGLTPGRQQMRNALMEARRCLRAGRSDTDTQTAVKAFAAFSGPMRAPLIAMLDSIGVNRLLGLQSVASLWDRDAHLAHFTSALRYPVFIDGKNYWARHRC